MTFPGEDTKTLRNIAAAIITCVHVKKEILRDLRKFSAHVNIVGRMSLYVLGLDIGTSTVKAALVERRGFTVYEEHFEHTSAATPCRVAGGDEQSVAAILSSLDVVMGKFFEEDLKQVAGIGISGQMHGCVLWKDEQIRLTEHHLVGSDGACSSLVTWQDGRCSEMFLSSQLPHSSTSTPIRSGYGCATLFWLSRYQPDIAQVFSKAGTVMDLVVWTLCGGGTVVMSDQNAASWGYFDSRKGTWEKEM